MNKEKQLELAISEIRGYLKASRLIMVVTETDKDLIRTFIMILSFGVEKSFKAIIKCIDGKTPERSHNLESLFDALSKRSRNELFLMCSAKPRHIAGALSTNKESFESWRYMEDSTDVDRFYLPSVMIEIMEYALYRLETEVKRK